VEVEEGVMVKLPVEASEVEVRRARID